MAPHLLMLPLEIRHEIFKYALFDGELYVADPVHRHRPILPKELSQNPNLSLHLICKQLTVELSLIKIPKWWIEMCCLDCANDFHDDIAEQDSWRKNVGTFLRHFYYCRPDARADGRLAEHVARISRTELGPQFLLARKKYEIKGKMGDPDGVDVIFYL